MQRWARYLPLILAIFSAGCAIAPGSSDTFYGLRTESKRIAFVIDASGSMGSGAGDTASNVADTAVGALSRTARQALPQGILGSVAGIATDFAAGAMRKNNQKLAQARAELISYINGLSPDTAFNVISFSDQVGLLYRNGSRQASDAEKARAVSFLDGLQANGGTRMRPPLEAVLNHRTGAAGGYDTVFLLSDGQPAEGRESILELARRARARRVVVHTIGVGQDQDAELLRAVADLTGGSYVSAGTRFMGFGG